MSDNYYNIEQRRLRLQAHLDSFKKQDERNRLGQFATPTRLARDVVAHGLALLPESTPVRFLDPANGTGALYSALLSTSAGRLVQSATGIEIDPHYGRPATALWSGTPLQLVQADFTRLSSPADESKRATLFVSNPPYVRHHHIAASEKKRLQSASKKAAHIDLSGLCGLYCHFMALAHNWLSEGGVGAWLIPSEFMDVNYGRALKTYLLREVTLLQIHRCDPNDVQFDDALVSSAVVFLRKVKPPENHHVQFSYGGTLQKPAITKAVSAQALAGARKWTRFPKHDAEVQHDGYRLGDLFTIKRGLVTGANDFFIVDEEKARSLKLPRHCLRPVLPSPRYIKENEIKSDVAGVPLLGKRLFLIDCNRREQDIAREEPTLWAYLETGVATIAKRCVCHSRHPWYTQERRPPAPIVCSNFGRADHGQRPFRFLLNHSLATATNTLLMLYPKPILGKRFTRGAEELRPLWRALNAIDRETLLASGRVYGGGVYKLEPRELANVPADAIATLVGLPRKRGARQLELTQAVAA